MAAPGTLPTKSVPVWSLMFVRNRGWSGHFFRTSPVLRRPIRPALVIARSESPQPHPDQYLSVLVHLELPISHSSLRTGVYSEGTRKMSEIRISVHWLHYADRQLAPLCRSQGGSIMPITEWLHMGDH